MSTESERLEQKVDALQATLDDILGKVTEIVTEVEPLVRKLSGHPILKMLGKG